MLRQVIHGFLILILLIVATTTYATTPDLLTVYQQALQADPSLAIAWSSTRSVDENVAITRAGLLPNISLTASATITHTNQGDPAANGTLDVYNLSLTQPIFNFAGWLNYHSSELLAKAADARYGASVQNLMVRVADNYFNVAEAYAEWQVSIANQRALAEELREMKLRFQVGLSKTADVANIQAAYDNSVTNVMVARANLLSARADLQAITGVDYPNLAILKDHFPLVAPEPNNLSNWLDAVTKQNLNLLAQRFTSDAARETIKANQAGYFPVIAANLGYSGNRSENNGIATTTSSGATAGISLNLPLYQGGLVNAETRQAVSNYETELSRYDLTYRDAYAQTEKSFISVNTNINKIKNGRLALLSNEQSLRSTRIAFQGGIRSEFDVLNAQQTLYQTQIAYVQARYAYFRALLHLKEASGLLSENDLRLINKWLQQ